MEGNMTSQQVLVAIPQVSKQDFLGRIADIFGAYNWPEGSIECINPNATKLVYLWGYRFKGTAEGSWTARVNGSTEITVNDKKMNIADGTPYSGVLPPIEFDLLVINDNPETPYWAKDFCKVGYVASNFQPYTSLEATGGVVEGSNAGNPHAEWMKNGNSIADNYLLPFAKELSQDTAMAYLALNILPADIVQQMMGMLKGSKFNSRDVEVSSRNSVTEELVPVLIPFYVIEFQFEGKMYHLAMMADSRGMMLGQVPPVRDVEKSPKEIVKEEMPDKVKLVNIMKWGWILAVVLLFVKFIVAVIVLVAWAVAYYVVKMPINNRIKAIERQSAANTQRKAEQLRRQLNV